MIASRPSANGESEVSADQVASHRDHGTVSLQRPHWEHYEQQLEALLITWQRRSLQFLTGRLATRTARGPALISSPNQGRCSKVSA